MNTIRIASINDLERAVEIVGTAVLRMNEQGIFQWDEFYPDKSVLRSDIDNQHMYVIENTGRVAGLIVLNEEESHGYSDIAWAYPGRVLVVHRLTIDPEDQGRKLASRLMDFAELEAASKGYDAIRLDVFSRNPAAIALYERCGYRKAGTLSFRKGIFFCFEKPVDKNIIASRGMNIRQATVEDAHQIARIHIQTWQRAYAGIVNDAYLQSLSIEDRTSRWREILSKDTESNFIVEDEDEVAGWISFGKSRDEDARAGEIYGIYVHPDYWGRGFGRELMAAAEDDLREQKFKMITLWVLELNERSRYFYSKAGYSFDGSKKPYSIGGQELWVVRYVKNVEIR